MKSSSENTKTNENQEDRLDSLEHKIQELEQAFQEIEEENVVFSRRVWFLFEELLDASYVLARILGTGTLYLTKMNSSVM